jgi:hypothetical protein
VALLTALAPFGAAAHPVARRPGGQARRPAPARALLGREGRMRRSLLPALALLVALPATAHIVPVLPSVCAVAPLEIVDPATGVAAAVSAPGPADVLRIVWDTGASTAVLCAADPADPMRCADPAPRPFVVGDVAGSLTLPAAFVARVHDSGDVAVATARLGIDLAGASTTIDTSLTTGLAAAAETVVQGGPIGPDGRFTLVGVVGGGILPPPLEAGAVLRVGCSASPRPDLDQFSIAPRTRPLKGGFARKGATLRVAFDWGGAPAAGAAAMLVASAGAEPLATVHIARLEPRGKRTLAGASAEGSAATLRLPKRGRTRHVLTVRIPRGSFRSPPPRGRVAVVLAFDVAGAVARATGTLRAQ